MIAELEKKFETQEKYYQDLKKENRQLRLHNEKLEKKFDQKLNTIIGIIDPQSKKSKPVTKSKNRKSNIETVEMN